MSSPACQTAQDVVNDIMGFFANNTHVNFPPAFLEPPSPGGAALWVMVGLLVGMLLVVTLMWLSHRHRSRGRVTTTKRPETAELLSPSDEESTALLKRTLRARDVSFESLGLRLHSTGATVLEGVTGMLRNGQVTAVMGPSGSGKTTFLSALAGRVSYGTLVGKTFLNGHEVALPRFQRSIGFVPQEDVMYRDLTVRETLTFAAISKGDYDLSFDEAAKQVDQIMHALGLTEIQNLQIGDENARGISGGQRKRVNVGIEVVSQPSILFLDEPTSGLDSSGSMEMLRALRALAEERSLTIAAVIHQPSWQLAQMFDTFMILSKGGRTAYLGPMAEMQPYFESLGFEFPVGWNPVDVVLDCVSGAIPSTRSDVTAERLAALWKTGSHLGASGSLQQADEEHVLQEVVDTPIEQRVPEELGTLPMAITLAILSFLFPPLALIPFYWVRTIRNQYASGAGYSLGTFLYLLLPLFLVPFSLQTFFVVTLVFTTAAFVGFITVFVLFFKRGPLSIWIHFAVGSWLGLLAIFPALFMREKCVFSTLLGAGINSFLLGLAVATGRILFNDIMGASISVVLLCGTGIVLISVAISRWRRIASSERKTAGLFRQFLLQFWRSFKQISRDIFGFVFDCFLPLFSGLSVGVLFMGKAWTPPLAEVSYLAQDMTSCLACDQLLSPSFDPGLEPICRWVLLANDPFPSLSVMASMGLGLVGAASALRVFGVNRPNFLREKSSGLSSESFFLGRSLTHLFMSALATLYFTVAFVAFIRPHGSFWQLYTMFLLVYQACAGIGMTWSIALESSLGGLMSLLTILSFVLFGGSLFIHGVFRPPLSSPLQFALWVPSNLSPLRWAYELCYLILIDPYRPYMRDPTLTYAFATYGFQTFHYTLCWTSLVLLCFLYRIVFPYVALVLRERKD